MKRTGRIIETLQTLIKRNSVTGEVEERHENEPYTFFIDRLVDFYPDPEGGAKLYLEGAGPTWISEPYEELLQHVLDYERGQGLEFLRRQ